MTRVLFVLDFFPPHVGGAETLFDNLTKRLADKGIDVDIVTQKLPGTAALEVSENRRIHRVASPFRHSFALTAAPKCIEVARRSDVVHAATLGGLATTMQIEKFFRKPVVSTFFEVWGELFLRVQKPPMSIVNRSIEALSLRHYRNHVSTAISSFTKTRLLENGFDEKKTHVIYPGIDKKLFNEKVKPSDNTGSPSALYFGRPGVAKGVPFLIMAAAIISAAVPGFKLTMLLSKNPRGEYKKIVGMVKQLGLQHNVIFVAPKPVAELPGTIKSADVCIVPSISEGFGFSAAESLSCGVPVVASNTASLPEIIKNGYNGLLSEPENPGSIAENVINVLSDKKLRRRLARNGPKSTRKFDWDKGTKEYIKVYESATR